MSDVAFDRLVRTYGDALSRIAWGYVANSADHDDLMQDVLIAIWRAMPRFRGEASEKTFLFRIAHNRGCTFLARNRDHDPLPEDTPIADPRPGPDDRLENAGRRERLMRALRTLPNTQRQAVLLRLEGWALSEIAALQNTSEANVSVRLSRGRDRLRELVSGGDE